MITPARLFGTEEQRRALRVHLRKYRITPTDRLRLAKALEALESASEGLLNALDVGDGSEEYLSHRFRKAVRLLVEGPEGEFK